MPIASPRNEGQRVVRTVRPVWLVSILCFAALAIGAALHYRGRVASSIARHGSSEEAGAEEPAIQVSAEELRRIKEALIVLDRKVSALEWALAARTGKETAGGGTEGASEPAKAKETRTPAEIQRDTLRSFDTALTTDRGDIRDRRATADVLKREIAEATQGKAQVVEVACAAAFCRATIEQDTAAGGLPLDVNALMDAAPSLKTEAMFDYQTEGTRKRTIVYAAREGQLLPTTRQQPLADRLGAAAAAPLER